MDIYRRFFRIFDFSALWPPDNSAFFARILSAFSKSPFFAAFLRFCGFKLPETGNFCAHFFALSAAIFARIFTALTIFLPITAILAVKWRKWA